ncbi:hypothetical protein KL933_002450 [Ogataea haglerorum]|uniref:Uncharacterized protein n=1 Tax=Ogataea haglerorum TaxID=1937702 RepID=A0AAN6I0U2_9ASCO|nr:uncharacterized protein KL911_003224 [Ogataea haglerorum]KAG7695635.1 hypothetical protein KL915_003025 [Ogataea haglerorum]KAG7718333.1 hypothetical protein KL913_002328 [Ogataea haglerorum]KAG7718818.1 hypothetical protein KL949_002814 [Ogataea haglerorum]KAG7727516.1 hypothetical protein KL933_002450 [Ogataea haglerorum]KAG7737522.1 hypothetical protein KL923_003911 [Ogataea haglerorum]
MSIIARKDTTRLARRTRARLSVYQKVEYCEENRCCDVGDKSAKGEPRAGVELCEMVAAVAAERGEDDAEGPRLFPEIVVVQSAAEHEVGDPHNNPEHHGQQLKVMQWCDEFSMAESPCVGKPGEESGKIGAQVVADHGDSHLSKSDREKLHNSVAVVGQLIVYVENIQCFGEHFHDQGREAGETADEAGGEGCVDHERFFGLCLLVRQQRLPALVVLVN